MRIDAAVEAFVQGQLPGLMGNFLGAPGAPIQSDPTAFGFALASSQNAMALGCLDLPEDLRRKCEGLIDRGMRVQLASVRSSNGLGTAAEQFRIMEEDRALSVGEVRRILPGLALRVEDAEMIRHNLERASRLMVRGASDLALGNDRVLTLLHGHNLRLTLGEDGFERFVKAKDYVVDSMLPKLKGMGLGIVE
jgi:hypothetical protein